MGLTSKAGDVVFIDFTSKGELPDATKSKIKQTYQADSSSYSNEARSVISSLKWYGSKEDR